MKKVIFKFWKINFLISIVLFIAYRIVIAETNYAGGNFLESVLQILDILLNLGYSFVYFIALVSSSFLIFLNRIEKIRSNFYTSLLTFIAMPSLGVAFIAVNLFFINESNNVFFIKYLLAFSILYLFIATVGFLLFNKQIKRAQDVYH